MKFTGNSIKWSIIFMITAIVIVIMGYNAGIVLKDKPYLGKVTAASVFDEKTQENNNNNGTISDTNISSENRITVGKCSHAISVDEGSLNLLILGEDKTSNLYDTIGIVNINQANHCMKIIMVPRDTYIQYNPSIVEMMKEKGIAKSPGIFKINNTHNIGTVVKYEGKFKSGPISFLVDVIKEKFGITVNDYIKVNTKGFVEFVNIFGGLDITVPYDMNYEDPTQDLYIHLKKGRQHLDGGQVEGFVRFRQGYKEDGTHFEIGDIVRKKNQVTFIKELISQHGSLTNINKIPDIIKIMDRNMKSSINMGDVMFYYMGIAKKVLSDKYDIESTILDGKQIRINGSAYIDIE